MRGHRAGFINTYFTGDIEEYTLATAIAHAERRAKIGSIFMRAIIMI